MKPSMPEMEANAESVEPGVLLSAAARHNSFGAPKEKLFTDAHTYLITVWLLGENRR